MLGMDRQNINDKAQYLSDPHGYVRELAGSVGLSVTELCRRAGISRGTPARWARGETSPSVRIINRIIDAAHAAKETSR